MADEDSLDACSRRDGDGAGPCRDKKRKVSHACCSYPKKKDGSVIRKGRALVALAGLAELLFMVTYLFTKEELEDEDEEYEGEEGVDVDEQEEDDDDDNSRADLLKAAVDRFAATKAWAECELGPENETLDEIVGMIRRIHGYKEARKAKEEAVKAKRCPEF